MLAHGHLGFLLAFLSLAAILLLLLCHFSVVYHSDAVDYFL